MFIVHNDNPNHIFETYSELNKSLLQSVSFYETKEEASEHTNTSAELIFLEKQEAVGHMKEETFVIDNIGFEGNMPKPIEEVINTFHQ
jgi:predicted oxidoreductase (fatty acid repression mutant protein)